MPTIAAFAAALVCWQCRRSRVQDAAERSGAMGSHTMLVEVSGQASDDAGFLKKSSKRFSH
jgi:hypothetical protein